MCARIVRCRTDSGWHCVHCVRGLVLAYSGQLWHFLVLRLMMLFSLLCSFSLCHGLFNFLIVCHTMFCSVRHTRVAMSAICILDWCICFLFYFLIVCHTMFCSVRHTRVAMSAILYFGLVYLFFVGVLYFCSCCWSDWRRREIFYIEFQCVDCELVMEYCTWMCFLAKQLAREPKRLEISLGWDFLQSIPRCEPVVLTLT